MMVPMPMYQAAVNASGSGPAFGDRRGPRCAAPGLASVTPREKRGVEDVESLAVSGHGPRPLFGHEDFEAVG
jgi:hypothetical protein